MIENEKKCNTCGLEKNVSCFIKGTKGYYKNRCRKCENKRLREKRAKLNPKEIIPENMKKCGKCGIIKEFYEFHSSTKRKSGYSSSCKLCKKEYVNDNMEKEKQRKKDWYLKNRDLTIQRSAEWGQKNSTKKNEISTKYYVKNKNENPHHYAWRSLLQKTLLSLGKKKESKTKDLLGYSPLQLKQHLEYLFTDSMDWDNYGEWHIDHIKPIVTFNHNTLPSIVNDLSNLRPLWATTREINGVVYEGNLNREKFPFIS